MAIMYPSNIEEYKYTESERIVYQELKRQLPDTFSVFYSVEWSEKRKGKLEKSEADFIVTSPQYGFLCLEVKGGEIRIDNNTWYISNNVHGERRLKRSPYKQAEESMYHFQDQYKKMNNIKYSGIYAAGAVFPLFNIRSLGEGYQTLSNRDKDCTIDATDMDNLLAKIKTMFKTWGGSSFGKNLYTKNQHTALLELIRKNIAVSAAAGALVKYKERQLSVINRVQDNYIYLLSNIRQFYIRGGAGTGKTWVAIKMANQEADAPSKKVLFTCASKHLAEMVRSHVKEGVDVLDIGTLIENTIVEPSTYHAPFYEGAVNAIREDVEKYDAVFVDEAQDFSEELACLIKMLLVDEKESRLGVFYDDVQKIREESFGDAFMIDTPPFLLRENIRNTANIYDYASQTTSLGQDVISNPVEGPTPSKETIMDKNHLTQRLESLLKEYLVDENLQNDSLVLLVEDLEGFLSMYPDGLAQWVFTERAVEKENEIRISSVAAFKGLEADMIIYIHKMSSTVNINYIAYTRAKYYLHELITK